MEDAFFVAFPLFL